jgi:hypothetical protein
MDLMRKTGTTTSRNGSQFLSPLLIHRYLFSCPGRFFANNEVKIVLAHLIQSFDFALPDGEGRPKPITYDVAFKPDPNQEVLFKRRS